MRIEVVVSKQIVLRKSLAIVVGAVQNIIDEVARAFLSRRPLRLVLRLRFLVVVPRRILLLHLLVALVELRHVLLGLQVAIERQQSLAQVAYNLHLFQ